MTRRSSATSPQDQANVFGYACRDTPELMPLPISLAHRLARALERRASRRHAPWLSPDGKTQVSVEYRDSRPVRIHGISLTAAVEPGTPDGRRRGAVCVRSRWTRLPAARSKPDARTQVHINAGAPYEIGGPARHAGLTGRKNGIDTYGEIARQSGAALSGKDPSRIDRIGAYAARHAAKNVVAAGLAERCEVHLAYAIGQARPLSLSVETFGTGRRAMTRIAKRLAARPRLSSGRDRPPFRLADTAGQLPTSAASIVRSRSMVISDAPISICHGRRPTSPTRCAIDAS